MGYSGCPSCSSCPSTQFGHRNVVLMWDRAEKCGVTQQVPGQCAPARGPPLPRSISLLQSLEQGQHSGLELHVKFGVVLQKVSTCSLPERNHLLMAVRSPENHVAAGFCRDAV